MGACCGKGASPKDPDKAPYGPAKPKSAHDGDRTPSPIPVKKKKIKKGKTEEDKVKDKKPSVSEQEDEEVEEAPPVAPHKVCLAQTF